MENATSFAATGIICNMIKMKEKKDHLEPPNID